jgi:hypothetical protein
MEGVMPENPRESPFWPADNPAVIAHINLLQGIINRLANNSASCKTWCLVVVSALLSLAGATHVPAIVTFALVPVVIFGFLDAMYLAQERVYRSLYTRTAQAIRDRSYTWGEVYELRVPPLGFTSFISALGSWSIYPVYLGLLLTYVVAALTGWLAALAAVAKQG